VTPTPQRWRFESVAWRVVPALTPQRLDRLLRARSAAILPGGARHRFRALGFPDESVAGTLRQIRRLDDWSEAWTARAQRFLGEARTEDAAGRSIEAANARRLAALSYHVAQILPPADDRAARTLRASAASLFASTVPVLMPDARRVEVLWRASRLPGYLFVPPTAPRPIPLAVFLNGATTSKEELLSWSTKLYDRGLAVLALDWPGTGEAAAKHPVGADCDDITDGILSLAEREPSLDPARVALVGVSLGGALAVRAAALDRRIAACVAVTPPYDATPWLWQAQPLLLDQLVALAGSEDALERLAAGFALFDVVGRLRCPLLVLGAGRDLVVPPREALRLSAAAGDLATLLWYPNGGHALYESIPAWTDDVARWLGAVLDAPTLEAETTPNAPLETRRPITEASD
jgi:2,6-dihydroxypseudooxynicotine hydrolase